MDNGEGSEVGYERMGEYAREQLNAARRDPRLDRERGALFRDFHDAIDEADRVRSLAILGIETLKPEYHSGRGTSGEQAAWELAEMAKAEQDNGHPHLNALTLIALFSAVDHLVEALAPSYKTALAGAAVERILRDDPQSWETIPPDVLSAVRDSVLEAVKKNAQKRLRGAAPKRWEKRLATIRLGPEAGRPLPSSLIDALNQVHGLRDVLAHQGGRIDEKAIKYHPSLVTSLGYEAGQFVRIDRAGYRRYSAALRAYGQEVQRRAFTSAIPDWGSPFDLDNWEDEHYILA